MERCGIVTFPAVLLGKALNRVSATVVTGLLAMVVPAVASPALAAPVVADATSSVGSTKVPGVQVPIAGNRHALFPWTLKVSGADIGPAHAPGICVTFLFAWGPGQKLGTGFPDCIAPASGQVTPHGTKWSFNLDSAGFHGVWTYGTQGSGPDALIILAVPQARSIRAVMGDGQVIEMRAHPLPAKVHRAATIAYLVKINPRRFSSTFRSAVAYDAHGAVVGRSK